MGVGGGKEGAGSAPVLWCWFVVVVVVVVVVVLFV